MKKEEREAALRRLAGQETFTFADLLLITELLRGEGGCPWDREQTHGTVRRCMIEEAYEVAEAIDKSDSELLCEELGDVLFQVVFHSELEREEGRFSAGDVVNGICRKMILRHPHVFGNGQAVDGKSALSQWEAIKTEEKQRRTLSSRLRAIPPILPALLRAQKVHEKIGADAGKGDDLAACTAAFGSDPGEETLGILLDRVAAMAAEQGLDAEGALAKRTEKVILEAENDEIREKK